MFVPAVLIRGYVTLKCYQSGTGHAILPYCLVVKQCFWSQVKLENNLYYFDDFLIVCPVVIYSNCAVVPNTPVLCCCLFVCSGTKRGLKVSLKYGIMVVTVSGGILLVII